VDHVRIIVEPLVYHVCGTPMLALLTSLHWLSHQLDDTSVRPCGTLRTVGYPWWDPEELLGIIGGPLAVPWRSFGGPVVVPWRSLGGSVVDTMVCEFCKTGLFSIEKRIN
jgi:hypothetical protein